MLPNAPGYWSWRKTEKDKWRLYVVWGIIGRLTCNVGQGPQFVKDIEGQWGKECKPGCQVPLLTIDN